MKTTFLTLLLTVISFLSFAQGGAEDTYFVKTDSLQVNNISEQTPLIYRYLLVDADGKVIGWTSNPVVTETDPVYTAWNKSDGISISYTQINDWATATASFLTGYTETDPVYTASSWYTTTNNASNWDSAYGWGDHALAGYLTTEVDGSITNEIQQVDTLALTGTTLGISLSGDGVAQKTVDLSSLGGGGSFDPIDLVKYQEGGWSAYNQNSSLEGWGLLALPTETDATALLLKGSYGIALAQKSSGAIGNVVACTAPSSLKVFYQTQRPLLAIKFGLAVTAESDFYYFAGLSFTVTDVPEIWSMVGIIKNSTHTTMSFITSDASSNATVTSIGVLNYDELYTLIVDFESSSSVKFYLYDQVGTLTASATHTTNIPDNTQLLIVQSTLEDRLGSTSIGVDQYFAKIILRN